MPNPLSTSPAPVISQRLLLSGGSIRTVALSPDGRVAAAGGGVWVDPMDDVSGFDPTAKLWDTTSGALLSTIVTPHPTPFRSSRVLVALLPDGRSLLTSGDGGMIVEWEVATGREIRRFGSEDAITAMALSDDGRTLATGGSFESAHVRIWDVPGGHLAATLEGAHDWSVSAIDLAGQRVVSASDREVKGVRVHDIATGKELLRFAAARGYVDTLSLSRDGERVLCGGLSKVARIWNVRDGKAVCALKGKRDSYGVAFHPDGRRALTTSDGALCVWDASTGALVHEAHEKCSAPMALSRDGSRAVTFGTGAILVWNIG